MNDLIEVKTADLIGLALDYAVGRADGREVRFFPDGLGAFLPNKKGFVDETWNPSTNWSQGGQLIEKHDVEILRFGEQAFYERDPQWNQKPCIGAVIRRAPGCTYAELHIEECMTADNRLVAACRAIVTAKLGKTVQVPVELVTP